MGVNSNTPNFTELEGGNDSGIELIYTFDKNKKLTGVVANIACPSQVLEQRSFISADFWGRAKANVRETLGDDVYLLGLGGAGGDQSKPFILYPSSWNVSDEEIIGAENIYKLLKENLAKLKE